MAKKLKTVLISQPKPTTEKSPYFDLADRQKLTIDFRPFIHVEGVEPQDFRQQRIDLGEHTAVILTSRNAVDHFFRLAADLRYEVPDTMKYFCISESDVSEPERSSIWRIHDFTSRGQAAPRPRQFFSGLSAFRVIL